MEDHGRRQTRGALDAIAGTRVCLDQAGVNGKALTADQPSIDAGLLDGLEQSPVLMPRSRAGSVFGRCETAHLRACSIGPYGGCAARKRPTVGNASMRSRAAPGIKRV